jgi:hypothetical protein
MKRTRTLILLMLIALFFVALGEAKASDPLADSVAETG